MVNVNNVLRKPKFMEEGESIKNTSELRSVFEFDCLHYIDLYVPVLQVKYFTNNFSYFKKELNLDADDEQIFDLINCQAYIVVDPKNNQKYKEGEIIKSSEYSGLILSNSNEVIDALCGGEAIKYLVNKYSNDENRRYLNFLLIEKLPIYYVSPKYPEINLFDYYETIIYRNIRLPKLDETGAPELIKINEKRLLQRKVNELIKLLLNEW